MDWEDIEKFLPQYLSEDQLRSLKEELRRFGENPDVGSYFTTKFKESDFLLQGDCVEAPYCDFPNKDEKRISCLLLSNTCDMDLANERMNLSRIMYAPLLGLSKYEAGLLRKFPEDRVKNHLRDIRNQQISQILYLSTNHILGEDSIVMFDRAMSVPRTIEFTAQFLETRKFTLSNFGFYLLLLKLSYHFTRIMEKIDRT